ncbi:hypothetical protein LZ198_39485 [Myxococcus sp. K15C18031901]|uniref:hypothetical protein n=1 Tax=Myxococcus dinghuensis TaxID=2906761 RepID=UPI0020A78375|nr:hypothetical protein [Myxococcus dinghuensis]MCP3104966.1 hypothetical protein [Myxococcus dinghuensis]
MKQVSLLSLSLSATVWMACATAPMARSVPQSCEQGVVLPCSEWGAQLLREGDRPRAIEAFGRACDGGDLDSCQQAGRLRLEDGDLKGAEAPLTKVYETGSPESALALAELHERRNIGDDALVAERLHREALSALSPVTELMYTMRINLSDPIGHELSFNIQPMAFRQRSIAFGMNAVLSPASMTSELNGFVAYQHYVRSWFVPYGRVMTGSLFDDHGRYDGVNVGGEVGAKLCLESLGHLNFAAGFSRGSPGYFSVGIGLDGIVALYILAHM